jgi:hypothetical protein
MGAANLAAPRHDRSWSLLHRDRDEQECSVLFITRFFAGVFGSAPVSNVAAVLGDIWDPKVRGTAVTFYALAVVGGPTLVSVFLLV